MASFFGSIQSLLKDRASGRYLAQVLRTLAVHDPEPVRRFVNECFPGSPVWPKNANVTAFCEEPIVGADAKGRMDLTLAINDSSRVRVEVKYDDQLIEGDEGDQLQIKKQIHACKADGSHLVLLTKNHLRRADADLIGKKPTIVAHRYHADLAPFLRVFGAAPSHLLLDYLTELGLVMNPIHQPSLYRFLHRLLKPWKGGGRVATRDLREGPSQLTSLMKNMSLIATDMSPALRRAGAKSARTPTIDLWFDPSFDGNDSRMGGRVGIQAQHAVGNPNNHLYVNYGFLLDLTLASRRIDWRIFGEVSGSELRRNKAKNCGKESVFVSQRSGTLFNRMDLKKAAINQRISALLVEALNGVDAMKLVTTTPHRHQLALIRKALSA